ncbi:MAG: IS1182 family transposase [Steroidobacteraceae bacterium]
MNKTYRPYEPDQSFLLPPSLQEWLPEDHLALFVLDVVKQLDLSVIYGHYERELRGFPPHHPRMMVTLLLYAYCVGVPSSRKIEKRTQEDVAFRVLCANTHPDHKCISEFRRIHLATLASLFVQVLKLCAKAGLVKLGHVALDGTKIKANASKHKAMSYERMKKDEAALEQKVAELLRDAEAADAAEDTAFGKDRRGDELPEDLRRAKDRLGRIRALKAELEAEAKEQAVLARAQATEQAQVEAALVERKNVEAARSDDDEPPAPPSPEPLPMHQVPTGADGAPTPKAQRNFTDAESRIMKTGDGFVQGYNAQIAVDEAAQIIVALGVSNQSPDAQHFVPMLDRIVENCGATPERASADNGYFSEANLARAASRGIDAYVATGRTKHSNTGDAPTESDEHSVKGRMKAKLATDEGKRVYSRRKVIVEPVFGQIKNRGFRNFLLRGLEKVRGEWSLIALSHNLLKLHAAG